MTRLDRQSFLGPDSESVLRGATLGIVGLCGGGSHGGQQAAHAGFGHLVLVDPQTIDYTNLNRMVGATQADVEANRLKVDIIERLVTGIDPTIDVTKVAGDWGQATAALAGCDVVLGCVDTMLVKDQVDAFCRRMLVPYIDIGMDVRARNDGSHAIVGQVALSMPGGHCLRCMRVVTERELTEEARRYGDAGPRPQVVWSNGILASIAIDVIVQLLTPWHTNHARSVCVEYHGNCRELRPSSVLALLANHPCSHYPAEETGHFLFDVRPPLREAA